MEDLEALEERQKHEKNLAIIEARKQAFQKSPFWFTLWDTLRSILNISFWLCFWLIVAQCSCECILPEQPATGATNCQGNFRQFGVILHR